MKKKDIILIGIVIIVVVGGLFLTLNQGTKQATNYTLIELEDKLFGVNNLTYQEFDSLTKQEGSYLIYIGRDTCSWCQKYKPELQQASEESNIQALYINTDNLTEEEYNNLVASSDGHFTGGTPTTLLMSGSKVVDEIGGYTTKDKIIKFFRKYGLID